MKNRLLFLAALIAGLALVGQAHAQATKSVSGVSIEVGEWTLVPTMEDSRVETILALRTSGTVAGDNISAVWFQRGRNTWRVTAWESQNQRDSITYVKSALGISDKSDWLWPIAGPFNVQNPPAPTDFADGLFVGDVMRQVVDAQSDRKQFLGDLVASGYRAAVIDVELFDLTNACVQADILTYIAEGIEIELVQTPETLGAGEAHAFNQMQTLACISICLRWTWNGTPTLVGCTCTWGPGGGAEWIGIHCAMQCHFTGNSTCTYTRVQRRRTWSCATCTWTETGTHTGTVTCPSTEYFLDPCAPPPPPYVCPPGPDCNCPKPNTSITWTGTPPC